VKLYSLFVLCSRLSVFFATFATHIVYSMFQKVTGVALRTIKYSDKNSILLAWSAELGRISLLMPAGAGAESRRRRALSMPLCLFEGQVDVRPGRDVLTIRDMRCAAVTPDLSAHPVKITLAMFLAEILSAVLNENGQADPVMWQFIHDSVIDLDAAADEHLANFHLLFLYRLGVILGVEPDLSTWQPGRVFDLVDGIFRSAPPLHGKYIESSEAHAIIALSRLTSRTVSLLKLSRDQRARLLEGILQYFTIHITPLDNLRSLDILRSVCNP
jgi:DNA repair protein RecO (recombination protein O)